MMGKGKAYHQGGDDDLQAVPITGDDVRRVGRSRGRFEGTGEMRLFAL